MSRMSAIRNLFKGKAAAAGLPALVPGQVSKTIMGASDTIRAAAGKFKTAGINAGTTTINKASAGLSGMGEYAGAAARKASFRSGEGLNSAINPITSTLKGHLGRNKLAYGLGGAAAVGGMSYGAFNSRSKTMSESTLDERLASVSYTHLTLPTKRIV